MCARAVRGFRIEEKLEPVLKPLQGLGSLLGGLGRQGGQFLGRARRLLSGARKDKQL
jgi:hypothetical protein